MGDKLHKVIFASFFKKLHFARVCFAVISLAAILFSFVIGRGCFVIKFEQLSKFTRRADLQWSKNVSFPNSLTDQWSSR